MAEKKKERVELQFNLENESEKELLNFIDQNGTTRAGFIKSIVRQYMNTIQSISSQEVVQQPKKKRSQKKKEEQKKTMPKLGSSFSSKDFE